MRTKRMVNRAILFFHVLCSPMILIGFHSPALLAWTAPVNIASSATALHSPVVVIDSTLDENGAAFWLEGSGGNQLVRFSTYDGTLDVWSAPQNVTALPGFYVNLSVAVDGMGNIGITFDELLSLSNVRVYFSYLPTGGVLIPPVVASTAQIARNPSISLGSGGNGFLVWENRSAKAIEAVPISLGGALGAIQAISTPLEEVRHAMVDMGGANDAIAVWENLAQEAIMSAEFIGGSWQAPQLVATTGVNLNPSAARSAAGFSIATWTEVLTGEIRASTRPSAGTWSTPHSILTDSGIHLSSKVGITSMDDGVAIWEDAGNQAIEAASYTESTDTWSFPPTIISPTDSNNHSAQFSLNAGGDGWASWTNNLFSAIEVNDVSGGVWGLPQIISGEGFNFASSIHNNEGGTALAVWTNISGSMYAIQASRDP